MTEVPKAKIQTIPKEDIVAVRDFGRQSEERMLKWFTFSHLPEKLQTTSMPFCKLAILITDVIEPGPERTVALRKLLEAKDAAVRATLVAGGILLLMVTPAFAQLPPGIVPPGGAEVTPDEEVKDFLKIVEDVEEEASEEKESDEAEEDTATPAPRVQRVSVWQQRAINKSNSQAARRRMSHAGPMAGTFEGVGYGSSPNCGTCVPRGGGWTLVADSSVQSSNGMWYRTRGWVRSGDSSVPSWTNTGSRSTTGDRRRFFRFRRNR